MLSIKCPNCGGRVSLFASLTGNPKCSSCGAYIVPVIWGNWVGTLAAIVIYVLVEWWLFRHAPRELALIVAFLFVICVRRFISKWRVATEDELQKASRNRPIILAAAMAMGFTAAVVAFIYTSYSHR